MYNVWDIQEGTILIYVNDTVVGAAQEIHFGEDHSAIIYRAAIDLKIIPEPFKKSISSEPKTQLIPFDIVYKDREKLINCWFAGNKNDLYKAIDIAVFNKAEIIWEDYTLIKVSNRIINT